MPLDGEDEHPPGAGFSPQQMLPTVPGPHVGSYRTYLVQLLLGVHGFLCILRSSRSCT